MIEKLNRTWVIMRAVFMQDVRDEAMQECSVRSGDIKKFCRPHMAYNLFENDRG